MITDPQPEVQKAPADWVDWAVVHRLAAGMNPGSRMPSKAERLAATREMLGRGLTHTRIAVHLSTSGSGARLLKRRVEAEITADATAALRAEIGPLRAAVDITVQWLTKPFGRYCDCGERHPTTCELSWWEIDPINPRDGQHHSELLARWCVPAKVRDLARYSDVEAICVDLGLCLQAEAERASRATELMAAVAA
jgi:hypothetical protein